MPKISVIVPVYKVEKYLKRCVDSILSQTFTDFELILVDDGSPDNCPTICDEYEKRDNRVRVIHQANGGLSAARNAGIDWAFANSDSEWLTFIDSDDWVHEKYLELLYKAVIETGASVSVCAYQMTSGEEVEVSEDNSTFTVQETEHFFCGDKVLSIIACGKLYKKKDFLHIRYPIGRLHEDEFTTYKILFMYPQIVFIDKPLYAYFQNAEGIMRSNWTPKRMDAFDAMEEQINFFAANNYNLALHQVIRGYMRVFKKVKMLKKEKPINQEKLLLYQIRQKKAKHYLKILNPDDPKDEYVLFQIYPRRMQLYIRWRALKNKIKKLFRQKS